MKLKNTYMTLGCLKVQTITKFYSINKSDIGFIKFIFEAHDGLAVVSTMKDEKDTIAIYIAPGCEEEADELVEHLGQTVKINARVKSL